MANRIIGWLAHVFNYNAKRLSDFFRYQRICFEVKNIETPFNIESEVEIRTPKQVKIEKDCTIKKRAIINGRSKLKDYGIMLGENTYIKENCYFDAYEGYIHIDGFCAFGQNTIIHGGGGVNIGKYVITGANCYIISSNHKYDSKELPIMLQGDKRKGITIEENVWLGGSVIVLDGVRIGKNSVIGAGTILTTDVPKNSTAYNQNNLKQTIIYK